MKQVELNSRDIINANSLAGTAFVILKYKIRLNSSFSLFDANNLFSDDIITLRKDILREDKLFHISLLRQNIYEAINF